MDFFKKVNSKTLFSDKKSIIKFIGFITIILGFAFSIANLYVGWPNSVNSNPDSQTNDIGDVFFNWICFFTIQSNLFILLSFFVLWIRNDLENKNKTLGSYNCTLAFTIYITITFLVYNFVLLPTSIPNSILNWIETILLHMVGPLLYIIYFMFFFNIESKNKISIKSFFAKDLYKILIYPIIWFIFAELRGLSRHFSEVPAKEASAYLYFFLDPFKDLNWLIIIFFVVFTLAIVLSLVYVAITNKRINKLNVTNKLNTSKE